MSNPKAFRTETDYPAALEAQKKAFVEWKPGKTGKAVMFFPTFTDPEDIPEKPEGALEVGSLDEEPGLFWVHSKEQAYQALERMRDGTWWKLLGIVEGLTFENMHDLTKIVVAKDPATGVEWCSVAARNLDWALELQTEELKRQFPAAEIQVLDAKSYNRK